MIDLSFLTEEEQESILRVLQRDAELKRIEDERVRHLPEKVADDTQIKTMSGQWFYEAKSRRHREKIHGADIIRASIRRKPLTVAEPNQKKTGNGQSTWVNSINKEVSISPEPLGVIEEKEGESKSNQSSTTFVAASHLSEKPQEETQKPSSSPLKARKNPFNDSAVAEDKEKCENPEDARAGVSEATEKEKCLPSAAKQARINLPNDNKESEHLPVESRQIGKMPVPKARKHIHKTADVSLQNKDGFPKAPKRSKQLNGQERPPKSILKRSSSSSSTDSEVLRINQTLEPPKKSGLPTSTILEDVAEKSPSPGEDSSPSSLERLKQVRFSSSVHRNECPLDVTYHEINESREFSLLDSDYVMTNDDSGGHQSTPFLPVKPSRSYSPIPTLNGNEKEGQISQENETTPGSYIPGSDASPWVKSSPVGPVPIGKTPSQIVPGPGDKQIVQTESQSETELLKLEPGVTMQSITGHQLPLGEKERSEIPNVGPADPKQGKPALVEGHSADKYAAESLKATDESISKVLDWFQRSSRTGEKENPLLKQQERAFAEEMDFPKTMSLSETNEDNGSNTGVLYRNSSVHEREETTSKENEPHEHTIHPGQLLCSKSGSSNDRLLGEQGNLDQSRETETAASSCQEQNIHLSQRTLFQTINQLEDKTCGITEIDNSENSCEDKTHLVLRNAESFGLGVEKKTNVRVYADGEKDVKSFLEDENIEHKSRPSLEEHKGKESRFLDEKNMSHVNRKGNLQILQQPDLKEPSLVGDKKRVKDIRAFWEGEKPSHKKDLPNESSIMIHMTPDYKKEHSRIKPTGGSSGYVTGDSDNEQSKYNLVTFRKVELSEEGSETNDDPVKLLSGSYRPIQVDTSTVSQVDDTSDNFHPGNKVVSFSKEEGRAEAVALEQRNIPSALQPKPYFKIHSLKEKIDEEYKADMLHPSQFQSLRSFWDVGTKPQSKADGPKSKATPGSPNRNFGSCMKELQGLKEAGTGSSLSILEDKKSDVLLPEERTNAPPTKFAQHSSLEEIRVTSKQKEAPQLFPSATMVPTSLDYALTKKNNSEGGNELPVTESIEKTVVSSKIQHGYFNSGLQKLLVEAAQESLSSYPPVNEEEILQAELVAKGPNFIPKDTNRKSALSANEIIEEVNRTLAPPKTDSDGFNTKLEKLLKETSDSHVSYPIMVDASEPAAPLSEKRDFFKRVMELSHHLTSSSDKKESKKGSQMKGTIQKYDLLSNQPTEFKTSRESLPRSLEESESVLKTGPRSEERQIYLDVIPTKEDVFLPATPNRAKYPEEEISEVVSKSHMPSRLCGDLNAKIASLLKELEASPTSESLLAAPFDSLEETFPQKPCKQVTGEKKVDSFQRTNLLRGTIDETAEGSNVNKKDVHGLILLREEPVEPYMDRNERIQGALVSFGKPVMDMTETVVKIVKTESCDHADFISKTQLDEDSGVLLRDREIPKPAHTSLQPDLFVNKIYAKDTLDPQEIIESVEKTTIPTDSRHAEFKANIQKLFKESTEIFPSIQKDPDCSRRVQTEEIPHWVIGLVGQQESDCDQEINETVSQTIAPSKFKQTEFNSGLQKLLEEASEMLSSQMDNLAPLQEKSVMKSMSPRKDVTAFKTSFEKLLLKSSDVPFQQPEEACNRITIESASELEEPLPLKMPAPVETLNYCTELKIPLSEKISRCNEQSEEKAKISEDTVSQNIIHLNLASPGIHRLEKGEGSFTCPTADKRENKIRIEKEMDIDSNEKPAIADELQRPSTPFVKSPSKASKVEFWLKKADDGGKGDARSLESNFSDENKSFPGIQRSPLCSEEELNPVSESLTRNSNRQTPSKSLEDIPTATSISTEPSFSGSQFSRPEKVKKMSKSVPALLQSESDDRETDTASESSFQLGRIKKSPSSLTNLSGSSGLASLSSVSTSVMSIYSGDFGNVDVKGNIQFAIDYVEQLKELHIFIAQGKDLAIADVKKHRSDPYVKSYLLPEKYKLGKRKTSVKKKTLNPVYNEILRYKVEKAILETQRLNISVWHNDTFGRNSFLGEVELDLGTWDWNDSQSKQMIWYPLKPRTPLADLEVENRGEIKIALQYIPQPAGGKKTPAAGEVHIWVKECSDLPVLQGSKLNFFVKCTVLPDTSRKSRQKTRAVGKTTNPVFNHTMVYDGFRPEDLSEACVELTVWNHNKLANHFLGGLRIGLGTGKSYGTPVDWMDSTRDEASLWERMICNPNTWIEDILPLRVLMEAKMTK